MLNVIFLGDKNSAYPKILENRIEINQTATTYDAQLVLATDNTIIIDSYLRKYYCNEFLIILDLRIPGALNLAQIARKLVNFVVIVMIDKDEMQLTKCVHLELEPLALLQEPVENIQLQHVLDVAYQKYLKYFNEQDGKSFVCRDSEGVWRCIKFEDVLWFKIQHKKSRRVVVRKKNRQEIELCTDLKHLGELSPYFFRSSRSSLINLKNVTHLDSKNQLVYLLNEKKGVKVSGRKLKELIHRLKQ